MASLTIRNIEESVKDNLRQSAARHGRSMEEEVRHILRESVLRERSSLGLGSRIAQRFAVTEDDELPIVARSLPRQPPAFTSGDPE